MARWRFSEKSPEPSLGLVDGHLLRLLIAKPDRDVHTHMTLVATTLVLIRLSLRLPSGERRKDSKKTLVD